MIFEVFQSGVSMLTTPAQVSWSGYEPSILFYNNSRLRERGKSREDVEVEVFQGLINPVQVGKISGRDVVASLEVGVQLSFGYDPVAAEADEPLQPSVDHQVKLVEHRNACDLFQR